MESSNNAILWQQLTENKPFISDLGASQSAKINDIPLCVGRYAVWSPLRNSQSHQVVEVGDNLTTLVEKYQIPPRILTLVREEGDLHG